MSSIHSPTITPNRAFSALLFNTNITSDHQTLREKKKIKEASRKKTTENKTQEETDHEVKEKIIRKKQQLY